jgi:hypothetical protein
LRSRTKLSGTTGRAGAFALDRPAPEFASPTADRSVGKPARIILTIMATSVVRSSVVETAAAHAAFDRPSS